MSSRARFVNTAASIIALKAIESKTTPTLGYVGQQLGCSWSAEVQNNTGYDLDQTTHKQETKVWKDILKLVLARTSR